MDIPLQMTNSNGNFIGNGKLAMKIPLLIIQNVEVES